MFHEDGAVDLVADIFQAGGREAGLLQEGAIGAADRAGREAAQEVRIHELVDQLDPLIGDAAAFGGLQQLVVVPGRHAGVQSVHDLEDLGGVVGIGQQLAHGAEGAFQSRRRFRSRVGAAFAMTGASI